MPNPHHGESQEDFISRFMGSPEALKDYPDQKQRAAVAYSMYKERSNAADTKWKDLSTEEQEAMMKILSEPAKKPLKNISWNPDDHPLKFFKRKETKGRADQFGLEDVEDEDLTPEGLAAKKIVMKEIGGMNNRKNDRGQSGKNVPMRFIEPGLVNYADVGMVLVRKETLDRMLPSIVGKPIFNESHKEVSFDDFKGGKADGIAAGNPRFNPQDGWFWVDGLVWDDETIQNGKDGYSLSCAYDVTKWGPGGVHNNIPYDREVLEGEYTHLAIVNNPRYEGARLIINQGGNMKLKFWQKDKADEPREMELVNAMTDVNGKEMSMEKVIELANAELKRQDDLKNAKATDESIIEVGGKKMTVKEAKDLAIKALKNAEDEKKKKDEDEEDLKNAEEKEKAEKAKKDKEDMENQKNEKDHEDGKHDDKEMDNCLSCKANAARKNAKHFEDLKNARLAGEGEFRVPGLKSVAERVAEGVSRYGSK